MQFQKSFAIFFFFLHHRSWTECAVEHQLPIARIVCYFDEFCEKKGKHIALVFQIESVLLPTPVVLSLKTNLTGDHGNRVNSVNTTSGVAA